MFIYTVKASSVKLGAVILAATIALGSIIAVSAADNSRTTKAIMTANENIRYDKIASEEDRVKFLAQFGWEVETPAVEETKVRLPAEFDKIMTTYNELQKSQGLDLHKYKGREVERYTYRITNYEGEDGEVLANLIIYKKKVIGGDICSAEVDGFIHGFRK